MADHASDILMRRDVRAADGHVEFTFSLEKFAKFSAPEREDLADAADVGWTELRTAWVAIHGTKAATMLDAMTQAEKDATRRTMRVREIPPT